MLEKPVTKISLNQSERDRPENSTLTTFLFDDLNTTRH